MRVLGPEMLILKKFFILEMFLPLFSCRDRTLLLYTKERSLSWFSIYYLCNLKLSAGFEYDKELSWEDAL